MNDAFVVINRLLKANAEVYWLAAEQTVNGKKLGTGTISVPASAPVLRSWKGRQGRSAPLRTVAAKPTGEAFKLKPIRIGLVDLYGGSMPSGWDTSSMLEQCRSPSRSSSRRSSRCG